MRNEMPRKPGFCRGPRRLGRANAPSTLHFLTRVLGQGPFGWKPRLPIDMPAGFPLFPRIAVGAGPMRPMPDLECSAFREDRRTALRTTHPVRFKQRSRGDSLFFILRVKHLTRF